MGAPHRTAQNSVRRCARRGCYREGGGGDRVGTTASDRDSRRCRSCCQNPMSMTRTAERTGGTEAHPECRIPTSNSLVGGSRTPLWCCSVRVGRVLRAQPGTAQKPTRLRRRQHFLRLLSYQAPGYRETRIYEEGQPLFVVDTPTCHHEVGLIQHERNFCRNTITHLH